MFRYRLALNAAAAVATVFALGAAARAADMRDRSQSVLELQPGMTKIVPVRVDRPVQAIVVGNPNIADASVINLRAIAITGKGTGLTNFILFDAEGVEISNTAIQVVGADAYVGGEGAYVRKRREVRVISIWKGPSSLNEAPGERRYLCSQNCGAIQLDKPVELNPVGNTSAAVNTRTTETTITNTPPPLTHR